MGIRGERFPRGATGRFFASRRNTLPKKDGATMIARKVHSMVQKTGKTPQRTRALGQGTRGSAASKRSPAPKSSFELRAWDEVVKAFRSTTRGVREQEAQHYDASTAFSAEDLDEWPDDAPLRSIYLMKSDRGDSIKDAKGLAEYSNFGNAIGIWNANGTARYAALPKKWIVVELSLVQEQDEDGDSVDLLLALWRVSEGWAAAVWECDEEDSLRKVIGLREWPTLSKSSAVWYGE